MSAVTGNIAVAEDCLQDAVAKAVEVWSVSGVPNNPQGWLFQVSKRRAMDVFRRVNTQSVHASQVRILQEREADMHEIADDRLRLMFSCCHPALDVNAQVALTLRIIGGLSTPEIARAFLVKPTTMGQRISRAKSKIRLAGIQFKLPEPDDIADRISSVLTCIYLIYNEGYAASSGVQQLRIDLCDEALFLSDLIVRLAPNAAEAQGLYALIRFSHARRVARGGKKYIPLAQQDRSLWDQALIADASKVLESALKQGQAGPYQLQAAVHGLHCRAKNADSTDWPQIAALYSLLLRMSPTPVVALNHAVALCFAGAPEQALPILKSLEGEMGQYQPFYAAMAEVYARLSLRNAAVASYTRAIALSDVTAEQDFLREKMKAL
ncbi:MAG: DUF6596 domain-containing protein [Pseudoruegeria sp.]